MLDHGVATKSSLWPVSKVSRHNIQYTTFLQNINKPRYVNHTNRSSSACGCSKSLLFIIFNSTSVTLVLLAFPFQLLLCDSGDRPRDLSPDMSSEIVVTNSTPPPARLRGSVARGEPKRVTSIRVSTEEDSIRIREVLRRTLDVNFPSNASLYIVSISETLTLTNGSKISRTPLLLTQKK